MKNSAKSMIVAIAIGTLSAMPCKAMEQTEQAMQQPDSISSVPESVALNNSTATLPGKMLRLTREECIAIALQDNPTVRVADLEIERYNYSKKEIQGSLFPSIDFSGAYQRTIDLQTMRMNIGGESQSLKVGSQNTWNFGFSASMPIISPTLWKSIQVTGDQILAAMEAARGSKLELIDQVNKAYYSLLLAIASRDVLKENYEITKFNYELYKQQYEFGTASEYDVLRSSVAMKNIEPELLQADIAIKQCQLQLKVLMGIATEVEIEPSVTLAELQRDMYAYPLGASDNISNNTSLRTLDLQTNLLKKTLTLKKFAYLPTLGLTYNVNWLALSNGNPFKGQQFNPYSTVGVGLSVPIFSGGARYNAMKQTQVQLKEMEFQREYLVNSLNMQVELALDNINREAEQISSSEESMKQAAKAHEIMQKSFEIGAASYLDLRDSELANTAAQLAYYQSIYNFLVSSSELDLLLGKEDYLNSK